MRLPQHDPEIERILVSRMEAGLPSTSAGVGSWSSAALDEAAPPPKQRRAKILHWLLLTVSSNLHPKQHITSYLVHNMVFTLLGLMALANFLVQLSLEVGRALAQFWKKHVGIKSL